MRIVVLIAALTSLLATSPVATAGDLPPAQVMLFGVFHFSNPGLDAVKTDQLNVMTDENARPSTCAPI